MKKMIILFLMFVPVLLPAQSPPRENDAQFSASLEAAPNAAALYALADELAEQGEPARAKQALRSLMKRFPTSPLVERAADSLARLPATPAADAEPAAAPKSPDSLAAVFEGCVLGAADSKADVRTGTDTLTIASHIEVTGWSGGCVGGKRDGKGVLVMRNTEREVSSLPSLKGWIEEPAVIAKILAHLAHTTPEHYQSELPLGARAPPQQSSLL